MIKSVAFLDVALETERFRLRTLSEEDVSEEYVTWFNDEVVKQYVSWRPESQAMKELREYVAASFARNDCLLVGIFAKGEGHVGNIKFDPIAFDSGVAMLGVLIGEPKWRNKGAFREVFNSTSTWLTTNLGVHRFRLGVQKSNSAAIRSYMRAGFRIEGDMPGVNHLFMSTQPLPDRGMLHE